MSTPYRFSHAARERALDALRLVAWADGVLRPEEVSAAHGAALVLGVDPIPARAWRQGEASPGAQPWPSFAGLTPRERRIMFAGGAWLALVDGKQASQEVQLLREMARRADIDEKAVVELFDVARWVRTVHGGTGSWANEFGWLLQTANDVLGPGGAGATPPGPMPHRAASVAPALAPVPRRAAPPGAAE